MYTETYTKSMKKETKELFSARLPKRFIDFIKTKTDDSEGLTQADIVEQGLNKLMSGHSDEEYKAIIEKQNDELKIKDQQLEEIEKKTGVKVQRIKKITFRCTLEQFNQINDLAHESKISKADLLRKILFPEQPKLESTNAIPKLE